jgi:hypothetical protein
MKIRLIHSSHAVLKKQIKLYMEASMSHVVLELPAYIVNMHLRINSDLKLYSKLLFDVRKPCNQKKEGCRKHSTVYG